MLTFTLNVIASTEAQLSLISKSNTLVRPHQMIQNRCARYGRRILDHESSGAIRMAPGRVVGRQEWREKHVVPFQSLPIPP